MTRRAGFFRTTFSGLLCLALILWSVLPAFSHVPTVLKTLQDHLEMIEDHGHSHGFEDDLPWAMHGHSHDVADHDHSQALLIAGPAPERARVVLSPWQNPAPSRAPARPYLIERPPRF